MLDPYKFELRRTAIVFKTQLNYFSDAIHQSVEILRLSVAAFEGWNSGDEEALFIPLDDDREFARRFHREVLARAVTRSTATRYGACLDAVYFPSFSKNLQMVSIPR